MTPRSMVRILCLTFYFTDYNSNSMLTSEAGCHWGLIDEVAKIYENIYK